MTSAAALPPTGSRFVGDWQSRPDLVALVDRISGDWPAPTSANLIRTLARRLDVAGHYLVGAEILADPAVASAVPAKVEWEAIDPAAVDRFAAAVPEGMTTHLLYHVARRLDPALQHALAIEILGPLGPALAMLCRARVANA